MTANDNEQNEYKSGAELLAAWNCHTREAKLERACMALMETVEELHLSKNDEPLSTVLTDTTIFCSCADAYRMGHEALKG